MESANVKDNPWRAGNSKLNLVLLVAAVCFAFAAFVIAIVSLSKQTGSSASPSVVNVGLPSAADYEDDKVWLLHSGYSENNQFYISEKTGKLEGFSPDILNAVCRIANKNCKIVADLWINCWNSAAGEASRGGDGLMAGWYDACGGYRVLPERQRTFDFSDQFTTPLPQAFATLTGNPRKFDWRNITGKIVGFFDGAVGDEHCLANAEGIVGAVLPAENIRHCPTDEQCFEWLKAETVDALFSEAILFQGITGVEEHYKLQACQTGGAAMMTRKDSKLIDWWNPAQAKLLASKEYHEICNDVKVAHGDQPGYDPEDFCIGL
ncbi:uncharacterized protein [Amphiura filiformis]|uniref:uncharacterized protein isoform X1 n=1 Tax=Amphiura filiformis TaxID=82378 RepID=UPI003B21F480